MKIIKIFKKILKYPKKIINLLISKNGDTEAIILTLLFFMVTIIGVLVFLGVYIVSWVQNS